MEAIVYEKRPGRWKISGSSKVYPTKELAIKAAADRFEVVKIEDGFIAEEESLTETVKVDFDPLEALRQARSKKDGNIEEGSHNDGDHEEQKLSEGSD